MGLVSKTERVSETQRRAWIGESNVNKPFGLIKPLYNADNVRKERVKYPEDVYTLTIFLDGFRSLT